MTPLAIAIYSFQSEFETAADLTISFIFDSYFSCGFLFNPKQLNFLIVKFSSNAFKHKSWFSLNFL